MMFVKENKRIEQAIESKHADKKTLELFLTIPAPEISLSTHALSILGNIGMSYPEIGLKILIANLTADKGSTTHWEFLFKEEDKLRLIRNASRDSFSDAPNILITHPALEKYITSSILLNITEFSPIAATKILLSEKHLKLLQESGIEIETILNNICRASSAEYLKAWEELLTNPELKKYLHDDIFKQIANRMQIIDSIKKQESIRRFLISQLVDYGRIEFVTQIACQLPWRGIEILLSHGELFSAKEVQPIVNAACEYLIDPKQYTEHALWTKDHTLRYHTTAEALINVPALHSYLDKNLVTSKRFKHLLGNLASSLNKTLLLIEQGFATYLPQSVFTNIVRNHFSDWVSIVTMDQIKNNINEKQLAAMVCAVANLGTSHKIYQKIDLMLPLVTTHEFKKYLSPALLRALFITYPELGQLLHVEFAEQFSPQILAIITAPVLTAEQMQMQHLVLSAKESVEITNKVKEIEAMEETVAAYKLVVVENKEKIDSNLDDSANKDVDTESERPDYGNHNNRISVIPNSIFIPTPTRDEILLQVKQYISNGNIALEDDSVVITFDEIKHRDKFRSLLISAKLLDPSKTSSTFRLPYEKYNIIQGNENAFAELVSATYS